MLSDDDNDDTMPMALFSAPKFFFLVFFSTGSQRDSNFLSWDGKPLLFDAISVPQVENILSVQAISILGGYPYTKWAYQRDYEPWISWLKVLLEAWCVCRGGEKVIDRKKDRINTNDGTFWTYLLAAIWWKG
jgi:hypothetical protein